MQKLKRQRYKILITIVGLILGIILINKIGYMDRYKGQITIENAYVNKISANITESGVSTEIINAKSYDEIKYEIKYKLDEQEGTENRKVQIKASLTEEEAKYAEFKEIKEENITSTLSEDRKKITIAVSNVNAGEEGKVTLVLTTLGAPNGFKVSPKIEIKEETDTEYKRVTTKEIEVQTKSITGKVRQEEGKTGLSNIELKLIKDNKEIKRTYTKEDGSYTFSDIENGLYEIEVVEENYEITTQNKVELEDESVLDITVRKVIPFNINVKKYVTKVKLSDNGKEETYTYGEMAKVNQTVKNLKSLNGEIEYKVKVKNTGNKEGVITKVEEELPEGLSFEEEKNKGWELKEGKLYNRNLEGITLQSGEEKEVKLILTIKETKEAKTYLAKVTVMGEIYEKVVYVVNNDIYKEDEVLEGETIEEISMPDKNGIKFSGWYTDKNYTNKYNFDNKVTKDIILYGKYEEEVKKYNVIFIDEGQVVDTKEYEEGSLIVSPEEPSKEGYTFTGWYEEGKEETYNLLTPVTKNITLYSKYEINKYTVTFKNEDGTILEKDEEVVYGSMPEYNGEMPSKTSTEEYTYTFKGWSPTLTEVKGNQEYIATYEKEKNQYTITFIDEGKEESETLDYGSVVTKPEDPEKEGYTFDGWYEEGKTEKESFPITLTKNITLYSKYEINKYTVSFYHNDEKYIEDQKVNYGEVAEKPSQEPSREDYNFAGWVNRETKEIYTFGSPVTKDIELESSFTAKPTYTVTFDIDGDTSILSSQTIIEGKTAVKPEEPNKKGYIFDGWYIDANLTEKYDFDTKVTENKIVYGTYNENAHKVTYKNDKETWEEEKVLDSFNPVGPTKGNPNKEGYTFKYWSLTEDGETKAEVTSLVVTEDITLYAIYEINSYPVVFKNYDGSVLQSEELEYGSTPVYKGNEPTKVNTVEYTYTFNGWDKEITEVTGAQEYIATYTETKNKYTITFIDYDGKELQSESLEYGSTPVYKGETPTREATNEYTYTFTGWTPEVKTVIENQVYKAEYTETKKQYTVTFMDDDEVYASKTVDYGQAVNELETNPTKEYNIFRGWVTEDKNTYDFSSSVTENITLYSNYELVEKPTIIHTPTEWTKENVTVTIENTNHSEYTYQYKIDEGEYQAYTTPFEISKNCIVVAKSIKENTESEIETHEITNIDTIKPNILSFENESITPISFTVNVTVQDNESGTKIIKIYKNDELMISNPYEGNKTDEITMTYNMENLEELTTYKVKVEVEDYAGNITISEEKEVTTPEKRYVAQIIGRNNTLNSTLIEEEIAAAESNLAEGETLTEEELEEIRTRHQNEKYESLAQAVEACGDGQCTVQLILDTTESVEILETQDITLDLNGKVVTGERDYTLQNSGKLVMIDNGETLGKIENPNVDGVGIKNTGILELGIDEDPQEVSTESPNITGTKTGIETTGTLNFYDGRVEGSVAISGEVTNTPYLYNAKVASGTTQVATLTILAEAEARINSTYYTKVANAMTESNKGSYEEKTTTGNLMQVAKITGSYGFHYDETSKKLFSNNVNKSNTTASSYIKIDLTDYNDDQNLIINAQISSQANYDIGYATVTESEDVPVYSDSTGRIIYISGEVAAKDYSTVLETGKIYYLHLGYTKNESTNTGDDVFIINSVTLQNLTKEDGLDIVTSNTYGFMQLVDTNKLISTNAGVGDTTANSYMVVDLSNEIEDKNIIINAEVSSEGSYDIGYVTITNSESVPSYSNSNGRVIYISGSVSAKDYPATLKAGQVNYIHIGYRKDYGGNSGTDTFTINSIKYEDGTSVYSLYSLGEKTEGSDLISTNTVPVLNQEVDTIELLRTITLTEALEVDETRDVVLDLRGQTLTTSSTDYVVKNNGSLKIIDSKYTEDIETAKENYENELAQNQADYEAAVKNYNQYKEDTQNAYDEEYRTELEAAIEENSKEYTTDDYVKENLVIQLDGINHGSTDSTWTDLSGNANDGTIYGATWTNDNGLSFDGTDDYVAFDKQHYYENVTMEAVVSIDDLSKSSTIIGTEEAGGYGIISSDGALHPEVYVDGAYAILQYDKYTPSDLVYVTYTIDSSYQKLYVDGVLVASSEITGTITGPDKNKGIHLSVGANHNGTELYSSFLDGTIYAVRLYNRVLTEEQVKQNYKIDKARYEEKENMVYSEYYVEGAGIELCTLSGRPYYKTNADPAYAAYYYDGSYTYPILVGLTPESVTYTTCGKTFTYTSTYEHNGKTYYVSDGNYAMSGNNNSTSGVTTKINLTNRTLVIQELLKNGNILSDTELNKENIFDGDKTTTWESTAIGESYVELINTNEKTITSFKLYGSDVSKYPTSVQLFGSKNGTDYETLVTSNLESKGLDEYNEVNVPEDKYDSYKYFKWNFKNEESTISIGEIEFDIYDVVHKMFEEENKIDIKVDNFSYNSQLQQSSGMEINNNGLYSYTSSANNSSVTYYNEKIIVEEGQSYTIKGNLGLWNNWSNTSLGTAYIGVSKTNEISTTDFESYVQREINTTSEKIEEFNVTIDQAGEYYFKIVMYHNNNTSLYTVYSRLYSLSYTIMIPKLKQAVLAESTLQGNITSTTGNVILNDVGSSLVLDTGIINVNKSGTSSAYTNGITNYGTLQIKENMVINNKSQYATAILNKKTGIILDSTGTINVTGTDGSNGLSNYSIVQDEITGLNLTLSNNAAKGILHFAYHDVTISNVTITGSGNAVYTASTSALNLEDNNINGYNAIESGPSNVIINVNSGTISASNVAIQRTNTNDKGGTVNINGGMISGGVRGIYLYYSNTTININGGTIESSGGEAIYCYYGTNTININEGKLNASGAGILSYNNSTTINMSNGSIESGSSSISNNSSGTTTITGGEVLHKSGNALVNGSTGTMEIGGEFRIDENSSGSGISNTSYGKVTISGNVEILGNNTYGINNTSTGTINIKDNVVINGTTGAIYNSSTGTINIGEKDGEISTIYPKMNSTNYGIYNPSGTINWYDGIVVGKKLNGISGYISDSEENYDLNIKEESETLENITLGIPTLEEFGEVVQIVGKGSYPSLQLAMDALTDNEEATMKVLKPIRTILTSSMLENKKATLDIDGNQLKILRKKELIANNGDLKITDSTSVEQDNGTIVEGAGLLTSTGGILINNSNSLNIERASLSTSLTTAVQNSGNMIITSGKIIGKSFGILNIEEGTLTLNSGTVSGASGIKQTSTNKVIINGGTVSSLSTEVSVIDTYGPLEINGGLITTVVINTGNNTGIYVHEAGTLLMTDGKIYAKGWPGVDLVNKGNVIIEKGVLESGNGYTIDNAGQLVIKDIKTSGIWNKVTMQNTGTTQMYGGSINGTIANSNKLSIYGGEVTSTALYGIKNTGTLTLGAKGDTDSDGNLIVSKENPIIKSTASYGVLSTGAFNFYDGIVKGTSAISGTVNEIEEGYDIITGSENSLEVKYLDKLPVAKVLSTGEEYHNLQEAIAAVSNDEDTVQILRDITEPSGIEIIEDKSIILDLQHYKITSTADLFLKNNGTVKIIDSVSEDGESTYTTGQIYISSGKAVENYGTFELSAGKIYADNTLPDILVNYNEMNISGGTINSTSPENCYYSCTTYNMIVNETTGILNVTGGTFYKSNSGNVIYNKNLFTMSDGSLSGGIGNGGAQYLIGTTSDSITNVTGGTFTGASNNYGGTYFLNNSGTTEVTGISENPINVETGWSLINNSGANLTMTNVVMENMNTYNPIANSGSLILKGGSYKNSGRGNSQAFTIKNYGSGNITINDAAVTGNYNSVSNEATGEIKINSGTIKATNGVALKNNSTGTITLGTKGDTDSDGNLVVSKESPLIQATGTSIANSNSGIINFYDGIIKGSSIISGKGINEIENEYTIITETEDTLQVQYLDKSPIAQIGSEPFDTLEEAIASDLCSSQCEIDIIRTVTILGTSQTIEIPESKDIILDLNGYKITSANELMFNNLGTLKITDSTVTLNEDGTLSDGGGTLTSTFRKVITNSNKLEIEKVKLQTTVRDSVLENSGDMTLTSVTISSPYIGIVNNNPGNININGGSININYYDGITYGIINNSVNKIIMNDVIISTYSYYGGSIGIISNSGEITITGGTISSTGSYSSQYGVSNNSSSTLTINGGTISGSSCGINNSGELNITNGTITGAGGINNSGELNITNGTVSGSWGDGISNNSNLTMTGGRVSGVGSGISNTGSLLIEDGKIEKTGTGWGSTHASIKNSAMAVINNGEITSVEIALLNTGTMNITGGAITTTGTSSNLINNSGTLDVSNVELASTSSTIYNSSTGTVNINSSVTITSTNIGVNNSGTGSINIGTQDKVVSVTNPIISGTNYGAYNSSTTGKINFYDGIITGGLNQSIYGPINVEPGYKISSSSTDSTTSSILSIIGVDESVLSGNGMNFTDFQSAINAMPDNQEVEMTLYKNIDLTSNITVSSEKIIKLYLNGHTINYNGYEITGEGKFTIVNGTEETTVLGSIISLVKDALDISDISKNIIVYEMNDGSKLQANKTYTLYKDDTLVKIDKEEKAGRYSIGKETEEMTVVRGRLYINNLSEGSYKVIDNDGKEISFNITSEGKVYGNVREQVAEENTGLIASAIAELIISIQTGNIVGNYLLLSGLISMILILLVIIRKKKISVN